MNFYEILGVSPDSSKEEIKKAYRNLVLKYHPDKNKDPIAPQKFMDVKNAYDILSDDERRREYDLLSGEQQLQLYDLLKAFFLKTAPKYMDIYNTLMKEYFITEEEMRQDVNNMDFNKIYNRFLNRFSDCGLDIPLYTGKREKVEILKEDLDIYGVVKCTLKDRYQNKLKKIMVHRTSDETEQEYIIPILDNEVVISEEGEKIGDIKGDIILIIKCEEDETFSQINDSDLIIIRELSVFQFLYGGKVEIEHLDGEKITVEFESFTDQVPLVTLKDKGLPVLNDDDQIIKRGSLFIHFKIANLLERKEEIEKLFPSLE